MQEKVIRLTGSELTISQIKEIAFENAKVEVDAEAMTRVQKARELIFELDKRGVAVYGLNTGCLLYTSKWSSSLGSIASCSL